MEPAVVVGMRGRVGVRENLAAWRDLVDHDAAQTLAANVVHEIHDQRAGFGQQLVGGLVHALVLIERAVVLGQFFLCCMDRLGREAQHHRFNFAKWPLWVVTQERVFFPQFRPATNGQQKRHDIHALGDLEEVLHQAVIK